VSQHGLSLAFVPREAIVAQQRNIYKEASKVAGGFAFKKEELPNYTFVCKEIILKVGAETKRLLAPANGPILRDTFV
jgi:hypothetical protein